MTDHSTRRPRDAAAARGAILEAAEEAFAARGFHGARVDAIALAAGYNKSLLFQYFGDKLGLYAAVLARADEQANELRARVFAPLLANERIATDARALRAFFETAFGALFDYLLEHPRMTRMLVWEMAEGWQTYTRIAETGVMAENDRLQRLFKEARHAGLIRSTFAPAVQLTLALQICQTFQASLPLYRLLPTAGNHTSDAAQARRFVIELIVGGILVDPVPDGEEHNT